MGAELIEWNAWNWKAKRAEAILGQLSTQRGIELKEDLERLEINDDDTFSYEGNKVLLYIRDQYSPNKSDQEYKYHICSCNIIQNMFDEGNKNRYVVTRNTSEEFYVCIVRNGEIVEESVKKMSVCKSCLMSMNYKGYGHHSSRESKVIYINFSLDEFFELYGETRFDEKPNYSEYTASHSTQ